MSGSLYELKQALVTVMLGHMVVESTSGRILGGIGNNAHRAWVFPLNTPRGLNVLQEYAFDHTCHNGVFVGQANVIKDGKLTNFWTPIGDWRQPDNQVFQHLGDLRYPVDRRANVEALATGFRLTYRTTWCDQDGEPVLDEVRKMSVFDGDDAVVCDVVSEKTTAYGEVTFTANKFGSVAARVQPQLLPPLGGRVITGGEDGIGRGSADDVANDKPCDYVAFEADPTGLWPFGLCLSLLDNSASTNRRGPWFVRDYGLAAINATMHEPIELKQNESWSVGLRVCAYDQPLTDKRARAWLA